MLPCCDLPGPPSMATVQDGLQADAAPEAGDGLTGFQVLARGDSYGQAVSCRAGGSVALLCADTHVCYNSASPLAADLWHAYTRGMSSLSTRVSYMDQHIQTNCRHAHHPHGQLRVPVSQRTTFPRLPCS